MFLHPQMQRSLYKNLRKIGETNQVIYTTHSPHFVSVPDYRDVLLVRRNEEGTYVVQSPLASDSKRREKLLKELDPERSELFFAKRLLLVEGDTEKLSFPEYAADLIIDLIEHAASLLNPQRCYGLAAELPAAGSTELKVTTRDLTRLDVHSGHHGETDHRSHSGRVGSGPPRPRHPDRGIARL